MVRKGKKWTNAKEVIYEGIKFGSNLELTMYKLLKEAKIKFNYIGAERAKYTLLEDSTFEGKCYERSQKRSKEMKDTPKILGTGYTPDFAAKDESWFIEVKGRKLGDFGIRWKLFKRKLNERDPTPDLYMPTSEVDCEQVVKILKDR